MKVNIGVTRFHPGFGVNKFLLLCDVKFLFVPIEYWLTGAFTVVVVKWILYKQLMVLHFDPKPR